MGCARNTAPISLDRAGSDEHVVLLPDATLPSATLLDRPGHSARSSLMTVERQCQPASPRAFEAASTLASVSPRDSSTIQLKESLRALPYDAQDAALDPGRPDHGQPGKGIAEGGPPRKGASLAHLGRIQSAFGQAQGDPNSGAAASNSPVQRAPKPRNSSNSRTPHATRAVPPIGRSSRSCRSGVGRSS